jgi:hypothetical protein
VTFGTQVHLWSLGQVPTQLIKNKFALCVGVLAGYKASAELPEDAVR